MIEYRQGQNKPSVGRSIISKAHLIEVSEVVCNNVRQKTFHAVLHVEERKRITRMEKSGLVNVSLALQR